MKLVFQGGKLNVRDVAGLKISEDVLEFGRRVEDMKKHKAERRLHC